MNEYMKVANERNELSQKIIMLQAKCDYYRSEIKKYQHMEEVQQRRVDIIVDMVRKRRRKGMKSTDIKTGLTYTNCSDGKTWRKVQCISLDVKPEWLDKGHAPVNEAGVKFIDNKGTVSIMYLSSFAHWAESEKI